MLSFPRPSVPRPQGRGKGGNPPLLYLTANQWWVPHQVRDDSLWPEKRSKQAYY